MKIIINQPFGLGDILFISPLIERLDFECAIWPVVDHYFWIKDYILIENVTFIKQSEFDNDKYLDYETIPFRDAHDLVSGASDCMHAKYKLLNADLEIWRSLKFKRNTKKEDELLRILNIQTDDKFVFINNMFAGPEFNYEIDINVDTKHKVILQKYIDGFTLLDWCSVLERATEIHTVSTSLFFVIESLNLYQTELNLYPRKPLDIDLSPIKTLINNKWKCYE
jgi:hypothetical protein